MASLNDKIIFLSGGASGIGRACADAYVREGARLMVIDTDTAALQTLQRELGKDKVAIWTGDVRKSDDVGAAIKATVDHYGRIDAIHNNAGIASPSKPLHATTESEWDDVFSVNLKSVYWTTLHGFPFLKITKGCILNTSSMVGEIGQVNHAAYVATKGAMNSLTKAMALDYAPFGIRVNSVCPAGVWTPMLRKWSQEQPNTEEIESYLDNIHALGYCPEGDVIADVAVFLISEAARFVTGCIMPVGGGAELGYKK